MFMLFFLFLANANFVQITLEISAKPAYPQDVKNALREHSKPMENVMSALTP